MRFLVSAFIVFVLAGCKTPANTAAPPFVAVSLPLPQFDLGSFPKASISITDELPDGPGFSTATSWKIVPFAALKRPTPSYPFQLLQRRIKGQVEIAYTINAQGSINDVRIVSSDDEQFSKAVLTVVGEWRYRPARYGSSALHSKVRVIVTFDFEEEPNQSSQPMSLTRHG
jgi:TonB family protein